MRNDTPPTPDSGEEQARTQAEAALRERGWNPITPYQLWESELAVGRGADDAFEASLWTNPDAKAGAPWLCDVGVTSPGSEKESLWIFGIPRPEEVPALLGRHADILSVRHGEHTLDLATGEVLGSERVRRLLGVPTLAELTAESEAERERKVTPIREALQAAWRTLGERGWETYEPMYALGYMMGKGRRPIEVRALPLYRVKVSPPYGESGEVLMLHLDAYYDDRNFERSGTEVWTLSDGDVAVRTTGLPTEYIGQGYYVLPLQSGAEGIPTPREAMRLMEGA